jgi:hypothetical protein
MGIVTTLSADWSRSWPVKVPASSAPPGRAAGDIHTVIVAGAVPLAGDTLNQVPPSDVLAFAVQVKVPVPPFRIWMLWQGGALPAVSKEKLSWPARLSKNGSVGGAIVSVTGTVMAMFREPCTVNTISPL